LKENDMTNPPEMEPLATIAAEMEVAVAKIRDAWQPMADAGIALAERLRSDADS
jgi:hypothetical protein